MPTKLAVSTRNFELVGCSAATVLEDDIGDLTLTKIKELSFKSVIFLEKHNFLKKQRQPSQFDSLRVTVMKNEMIKSRRDR